jgi:hypothetical protein
MSSLFLVLRITSPYIAKTKLAIIARKNTSSIEGKSIFFTNIPILPHSSMAITILNK